MKSTKNKLWNLHEAHGDIKIQIVTLVSNKSSKNTLWHLGEAHGDEVCCSIFQNNNNKKKMRPKNKMQHMSL